MPAEVPREAYIFLLAILHYKGALHAHGFISHLTRLQFRLRSIARLWLLDIPRHRCVAPLAAISITSAAAIASAPIAVTTPLTITSAATVAAITAVPNL